MRTGVASGTLQLILTSLFASSRERRDVSDASGPHTEPGGVRIAKFLIYVLAGEEQAKDPMQEKFLASTSQAFENAEGWGRGADDENLKTSACKNQDNCKWRARTRRKQVSRAMRVVGYARVSTTGQTLDAQLEQLCKAGCATVFREKVSGAKSDRTELRRLLASIGEGDVLIVTRLDRLARSTRDLLNIITVLGERGASFRSLADAWADTTSPQGRLMLTVLGGLAEYERELIRARTMEGRARAAANGVKMGRRPKLSPAEKKQALSRKCAGENLTTIALSFKVSTATISRLKPA